MVFNILGTQYEIKFQNETECKKLKTTNADGLAELYSKELIINSEMDDGSGKVFDNFIEYEKKVIRHEIVHAYFHESGLQEYENDETLTDWLALQLPKMFKSFQEANCM